VAVAVATIVAAAAADTTIAVADTTGAKPIWRQ
jgi:hypothetical protein